MNEKTQVTIQEAAGADIAKGQFVKYSSGDLVPCDTIGEDFAGVATDDFSSGDQAVAVVAGAVKVLCSDTSVTRFDKVQVDGNGEAVALTGTSAHIEAGRALDDARAQSATSETALLECVIDLMHPVQ